MSGVIELLDDSSGDDEEYVRSNGAPVLASTPARRKRRREVGAGVAASGVVNDGAVRRQQIWPPPPPPPQQRTVLEIDDSDDGGGGKIPAVAAAPGSHAGRDSDGSFVEVISPAPRLPATSAAGAVGASREAMAGMTAASSSSAAAAAAGTVQPNNPTPLNRILDIFPDICPGYATEVLRKAGMNPTRIDDPSSTEDLTTAEENMINLALSDIVEMGASYPKNDRLGGAAGAAAGGGAAAASEAGGGGFVVVANANKRKASYLFDYSSTSSFTPTDTYKEEVVTRLMVAFCFLSREGVRRHLAQSHGRYSLCYARICDAVAGKDGFAFGDCMNKKQKAASSTIVATAMDEMDPIVEDKLHKRLRAVRAGCAITPEEVSRLRIPAPHGFTATLRRSRRIYRPAEATDKVLLDEVRYAADKLAERAEVVANAAERQRIHDSAEKSGATLECQCCYGDYAFEELVSCRDEGHLFCMDCVRRYAEERVFGLGDLGGGGGKAKSDGEGGASDVDSNDLLCMHPDGCRSNFQYEFLKKALPPKVMEKYDELQATRAMEIAGVEGLCRCPKCDFQAVLSPEEKVFRCPVDTCRFESCKLCGEPSHIPLKCEEVEKQNETDGRKKVEEAMTAARVRVCPKPGCGKRFFKIEGCNKMTCSCQTWSCYVCRALIPINVAYKHFCQTPHCEHKKCGLCPLYSNAAEDDIRAAKEAGEQAANEVLEGTQKMGAEVRVDVKALLKNADASSPRRSRHGAQLPPPGMPPPRFPVAAARAAPHGAGYVPQPPPPPPPPPYHPPGHPVMLPPVAGYPGYGGLPPPRRRRRRR